jgi:hypothetical protein
LIKIFSNKEFFEFYCYVVELMMFNLLATTHGIRAPRSQSGALRAKFPAPTPAPPNLQTKHKIFNTNINIKEIHIENVKTNLPK